MLFSCVLYFLNILLVDIRALLSFTGIYSVIFICGLYFFVLNVFAVNFCMFPFRLWFVIPYDVDCYTPSLYCWPLCTLP